jgi:hypothetical protein
VTIPNKEGNVPWEASYLPDLDAVLTVYCGVIPPGTLKEAVEATLDLGQERGTTRFLADCTSLEGGHSVVDLYGLAALVESVGATREKAGIARESREALVLPQLDAAAREVEFWETTCRNRGFDVRVFAGMAEARAWLLEGPAAEA